VPADATKLQRVYVIAPAGSEEAKAERVDIDIWVEDPIATESVSKSSIFNGKAN
jgi:hypothetical protein